MKAGDKFIELTGGWDRFDTWDTKDTCRILIHKAKQISKDGLKVKTTGSSVFNIDHAISSYEQVKSAFETLFGNNQDILFDTTSFYAGRISKVWDDDFDYILHVETSFTHDPIDFQGQCLQDNDESTNHVYKYFTNIDTFAKYISALVGFKKQDREKPHKISDWLHEHGYFEQEQEAEFRKSYSEKDLLYAADNNIHPQDFEHWQAWKRVLKGRFLPYEDAMALENTLEEKTDGLTIYDYE